MKTNLPLTKNEAVIRLRKYCAYQDRCHQEVRNKLFELKFYGDELEEVISELIQENFLNEERFARSYARGKFRFKNWGKRKILGELKRRKISEYCIKKAFTEIEEEEYMEVLYKVLEKKIKLTNGKNKYEIKQKVVNYAIQRGFESFLIWPAMDELYPL